MRRPPTSEIIAFLSSTSLLRGLDEPALRAIAAELEYVYLSGGETLMREGEIGDALYVLLNGRLRIVASRPGKDENVVNEIGPGETVGEMAILTGEPRSATVRTIRDCALVKFSKAAFDDLVEKYPKTMMQPARLIVLRFQEMVRSPRFGRGAPPRGDVGSHGNHFARAPSIGGRMSRKRCGAPSSRSRGKQPDRRVAQRAGRMSQVCRV